MSLFLRPMHLLTEETPFGLSFPHFLNVHEYMNIHVKYSDATEWRMVYAAGYPS